METRNCRSCCEAISVAATKCPHCQAFQSRWVLWFFILPGVLPVLLIVPLLNVSLRRLSDSSTNVEFALVKHQLTVTNAQLKYREPDAAEGISYHYFQQNAWLYFTIHNESAYRWDNLEFLIEFQDANGERIDVDNASASVTTQPHSELEVRISCELAVDPKDVAKSVVTVTNAQRPYR